MPKGSTQSHCLHLKAWCFFCVLSGLLENIHYPSPTHCTFAGMLGFALLEESYAHWVQSFSYRMCPEWSLGLTLKGICNSSAGTFSCSFPSLLPHLLPYASITCTGPITCPQTDGGFCRWVQPHRVQKYLLPCILLPVGALLCLWSSAPTFSQQLPECLPLSAPLPFFTLVWKQDWI